jgi:hypothetical protein
VSCSYKIGFFKRKKKKRRKKRKFRSLNAAARCDCEWNAAGAGEAIASPGKSLVFGLQAMRRVGQTQLGKWARPAESASMVSF